MICIYCLQGLEAECENILDGKTCLARYVTPETTSEHVTRIGPGRPRKPDDEVQDISTGRRRANVDFPVDKAAPCEWRGLANCGGGKYPIVGCSDGNQQVTHHGPDKSVLNNTVGNVHRIDPKCHNRWHASNDKDYDPSIPHSPIPVVSLVRQYFQMLKWQPEALKGYLSNDEQAHQGIRQEDSDEEKEKEQDVPTLGGEESPHEES